MFVLFSIEWVFGGGIKSFGALKTFLSSYDSVQCNKEDKIESKDSKINIKCLTQM